MQWIDGDQLRSLAYRQFQGAQHARVIGAGILADEQNGFGFLQILERDRSFADADRLLHGHAARFMAHVGAIGQVVGAELPHEQLV